MTGEEIKQARMALGWTQAAMAKACGVSTKRAQDWEYGRGHPSGSAVIILCAYLYDGGTLPPVTSPTPRKR